MFPWRIVAGLLVDLRRAFFDYLVLSALIRGHPRIVCYGFSRYVSVFSMISRNTGAATRPPL